ncbi:MAG: hypothetical protein QM762_19810 [Chryseolinea sp.]
MQLIFGSLAGGLSGPIDMRYQNDFNNANTAPRSMPMDEPTSS